MSQAPGDMPHAEPAPTALPIAVAPIRHAFIPQARQVELDADGRINEEVLCRRCGYNLRGLILQGSCPECGTLVARSIHGDLLRLSDPRWVERLAAGTLWIIIGLLGGVALSILMGLGGALYGAFARNLNLDVLTTGGMIVGTVMAAVQVVGYWLVTTPDPGSPLEDGISARVVARYSLMAVIVVAASQGLVTAVSGGMPSSAGTWSTILSSTTGRNLILAAATLSIVTQVIGYFALFRHAAGLALRIPHPSLAWQARAVMWGYAAMQVLALVSTVLVFQALPTLFGPGGAAGGGGPRGGGPAIFGPALPWLIASGVVGCISAPVALTFQIWAIILLFRFGSQFKAASAQARATWATSL